jgi:hypothetical protein
VRGATLASWVRRPVLGCVMRMTLGQVLAALAEGPEVKKK